MQRDINKQFKTSLPLAIHAGDRDTSDRGMERDQPDWFILKNSKFLTNEKDYTHLKYFVILSIMMYDKNLFLICNCKRCRCYLECSTCKTSYGLNNSLRYICTQSPTIPKSFCHRCFCPCKFDAILAINGNH